MAHAEISEDGSAIVVTTKWQEKELIKLVPGSRWSQTNRIWTVPLTWPACLQLRGIFTVDLEVGPNLAQWSWTQKQRRIDPSLRLRNELTVEDPDPDVIGELYPFQAAAVEFIKVTGGQCLIGDQLGLGKTITALSAIHAMEGLPALVICPNGVKKSWADKAALWLPEATIYLLHGSAAVRRRTLTEAAQDPSALVIINIESARLWSRLAPYGSVRLKRCIQCDPAHGDADLTPGRCEVHPKPLNHFGFKTVVLDEGHRVKDPKSKQTRACWAVGHDSSVQYRLGLTGTPIANHIGDLFAVMHFVAPREWPTKSKIVDRYALQAWNAYGGLDVVGVNPTNREEFYGVLDPRFRRVLKDQVLDQIPEKIRDVRWVEMTPKQAVAYREVERQLMTELEDGSLLTVENNLVKATRLTQLAASYATVEWIPQPLTVLSTCSCYGRGLNEHDPNCPQATKIQVTLAEPSPKLDAMEEILDELGSDYPVIIAAQSRQLIDLAAARFKKNRPRERFGLITGAQDEWERDKAIKQLQVGDIRAVLMTIDAGGTGVDGLQVADTMIVLQRSWSMIANTQLEGRIDRIGQRSQHVKVIDIVAQDTIEETKLWPRLAEKFERLEEINRDRAKLAALGKDTEIWDLEEIQIMNSSVGA